jgi:hypothetical protein
MGQVSQPRTSGMTPLVAILQVHESLQHLRMSPKLTLYSVCPYRLSIGSDVCLARICMNLPKPLLISPFAQLILRPYSLGANVSAVLPY